jgi:sensor c-di-GMP phosphodiesterase-like protein
VSKVSEKEALQNAADEARKVARAAREFSRFLDDYAKYLTQPAGRERAVELHLSALNKLSAINAGLITCSKWVTESSKSAFAQPSEQAIESGVSEKQAVLEPGKPRAVQIKKKGSMI